MKAKILEIAFAVLVAAYVLNGSEANASERNDIASTTVPFGTAPTIDGNIETDEWKGSTEIRIGSERFLYLKHDGTNLHLAIFGRGKGIGTVFVPRGDKVFVLHASYSLGWAEYLRKQDEKDWDCTREFLWEHRNLNRLPKEEAEQVMREYLSTKGWVASTIPMGKASEMEFTVSLEFLGIEPPGNKKENQAKDSKCKSVITYLHLDKGSPTMLWPGDLTDSSSNERLFFGYNPKPLRFDFSQWGSLNIPTTGQ